MLPATQTTTTESETTPGRRKSTRARKPAQPFIVGGSQTTPSKRKRQSEPEPEIEEPTEEEDDADKTAESAAEEGDDYVAPKKLKGASTKGKGRPRRPPAAKKQRVQKATVKGAPRGRRKKAGDDTYDAAKVAQETKISDDNALFNAIMNPSISLQSTVEEFLESLSQSQPAALADLVNCILRACGSNDSVDADRAVDYDGIVDALDDFTEVLKEDNAPTYPIMSKLPVFKKFRKSLSEFLSRLVLSSAELGSLYTTDLMLALQAWVVAMSSSQLRSFRHTATLVALEVETALCDVASAVEKEAEIAARQREGERKRKAKGGASNREKEFEGRFNEVRERRAKVTEYLKEIFDGVFVHRYRDLDPSIRAECVHAIGAWLDKFPAYFLDGQYLRYIGWVLSDSNKDVRLEAVKSLVSLYDKEDYIMSLHHFTERFKPRLVEMARCDTELPIRVAVINVLSAIDRHSLLDDDQREALCLLIFDEEPKVRVAISSFVHGIWEETMQERLVGKSSGKTENDRAGIKALVMLLNKWARILDKLNVPQASDANPDREGSSEGLSPGHGHDIPLIFSLEQKGRIALAIEALWEDVEVIQDYDALLELLLLDHSARTDPVLNGSPVRRKKSKPAMDMDDGVVDEAWRLEEVEEALLLEILVTSLRKHKEDADPKKKGEDSAMSEITRALIKALPGLFAKHQTDEGRIANVLLIPELMNLDMYLEMRVIAAYEALWDDVVKQFLDHSSQAVLLRAMSTIRHLMNTTSLSNTNSTKILELEDELSSSLRDAVAGRDELEVTTFGEDEALSLGSICARIAALSGTRSMIVWMEEDEGGKQSSAWDIICALAERGRLGYKNEETMVDQALQILSLHIIWKAKLLMAGGPAEPAPAEDSFRDTLREQRDLVLEKLLEFALGTQSNTAESVKRTAFQYLLTMYTLFNAGGLEDPEGKEHPLTAMSLEMGEEVQYRCAGFVQSEIDRYAEDLESGSQEPLTNGDKSGSDSGSGSEAEDAPLTKTKTKGGKGKKVARDTPVSTSRPLPRNKLEAEYVFNTVISAFLRAIRANVIHVRHGGILLAHFGRVGPSFDLSVRIMVDILREEGMYKDNGDVVEDVLVRALQEAFTLVTDRVVTTEEHTVLLAKMLSSCLIIRGAQLSVVKRLEGQHVVGLHSRLVTWIVKRIAAYQSNENKRAKKAAISLFRALAPLTTGLEIADAQQIKIHLDEAVRQAKLDVSPVSALWEPYRAYERRISGTKEKGAKGTRRSRKAAAQNGEYITTDDDEADEVEGLMAAKVNGESSQPKPHSQSEREDGAMDNQKTPKRRGRRQVRPRPRPAYRTRSVAGTTDNEEQTDDPETREVTPVASRASSRRSLRSESVLSDPPDIDEDEDHDKDKEAEATPRSKRQASPPDEERMDVDGEDAAPPTDDNEPPIDSDEVIVRRKRIRR